MPDSEGRPEHLRGVGPRIVRRRTAWREAAAPPPIGAAVYHEGVRARRGDSRSVAAIGATAAVWLVAGCTLSFDGATDGTTDAGRRDARAAGDGSTMDARGTDATSPTTDGSRTDSVAPPALDGAAPPDARIACDAASCPDDGNPCTSAACGPAGCESVPVTDGTSCTGTDGLVGACCAGACVDRSASTTHCGACGNVCGADAPLCRSGVCTRCDVDSDCAPGAGRDDCLSNIDCVGGRCEYEVRRGCFIDGRCWDNGETNPSNPCLRCSREMELSWSDATSCEDGLFCTTSDTCRDGVCIGGGPRGCDDGNACTSDACNEATDACDHAPDADADGVACDDADACTSGGSCRGGACEPGATVACVEEPDDPCTVLACNPATGACEPSPVPDSICDDGNCCTSDDRCTATGECRGVTPPPPGPCITWVCAVTGCVMAPLGLGAPCSSTMCPTGACFAGICTC